MKPSVRTFAVPAVAAALLGVMIATNAAGTMRTAPGTVEYFERVKETIEDVPMQSGPWLGVEIPVIAAAQDLLQPNKIMQRRYTHAETRERFDLLIVHCGDVRDMLGHYPPVCYKANGWRLEQRTPMSVEIVAASGDVGADESSGSKSTGVIEAPATRYAFGREVEFVEERIRIINLFALPKSESDVSFGRDLSLPDRAGRFRNRARLGSAQVQIIVPAEMDAPRRNEIVAAAMDLISPVLLDVERGPM